MIIGNKSINIEFFVSEDYSIFQRNTFVKNIFLHREEFFN